MADFFMNTTLGILLVIVGQILLVVVPLLLALAFLMYADRKIWAAVMMRRGPNVVGVFGLLQSFADFGKYIVKEIVVPAGADKAVFFMAPMVTLVMSLIAWAVIPFNDGWVLSNINVAISICLCGLVFRGVRRDHGRVGFELQIPFPWLSSLCRPDDFL